MPTPESPFEEMAGPPGGHGLSPEQLVQINRLATIARLVSGLAHELNNSLQIVSGLVELLSDRPDLPLDSLVRIQKIGGQADRAGTVIRQVLSFVREPVAGRAVVDLADVVDRSVALRRYQLERQGISVEWKRPTDAQFQVVGQERALQQVVINLLSNAEEALIAQVERRLRIAVARSGALVQVIVADSGPGVRPDWRERIFEPFVSTRRSERGVGLGLTVGAAVAAAHGGRLYLTDDEPGATFVLELPVRS